VVSSEVVDILLVEDNRYAVELTMRALVKHGLANHVLVVRDGEEALDFLFATGRYSNRDIENAPKVILLDLKIPKMDGLEILRRIKSDERTKVIPVVVLTSSREQRDIVQSYELGANSYMVKPIEFKRFTECISELGLYWLLYNEPARRAGPEMAERR